jgi:acyl dehydratase
MTKLTFDNIKEGDQIPALQKEAITQIQLIKYAGASGDFNPIHTIPEYAKAAGLDGTIAHGMLVMGMMGQMITSWVGVKPVKEFSVSFKAITRPGDILTAKGEVKRKFQDEKGKFISCKIHIEDQKGEIKVGGKVTIQVD